jgi:hypothetical protein
MRFHEVPQSSMRFYDAPVNQSVPTEAYRDLNLSHRRTLKFSNECLVEKISGYNQEWCFCFS